VRARPGPVPGIGVVIDNPDGGIELVDMGHESVSNPGSVEGDGRSRPWPERAARIAAAAGARIRGAGVLNPMAGDPVVDVVLVDCAGKIYT